MMEDIAAQLASLSQPIWTFCESFAFIADQSYVFTSSPIDAPLVEAATSLGMDLRLIKYMVCLVLAYPLCLIFRFLPLKFPVIRHVYVSFIGATPLRSWMHALREKRLFSSKKLTTSFFLYVTTSIHS